MTPQQFLAHLKQDQPAPAYLFLGPEPYRRDWCRNALIQRVLPGPEERDNGLSRFDLEETTLAAVIEDACSLSLFATRRVLIVANAEGALPKGRSADDEGEAEDTRGSAAVLASYLKNPTPDTVLVLEAARYDFQGDDKRKLERVRKFFSAVPIEVEFPQMAPQEARQFAQNLARRAGLNIGPEELELLVEGLGNAAVRIASEIEKLRLWSGGERPITALDIADLVPEARQATIFALVAALGRNDRVRSLEVLDTLVRQSEYLPLALSFLGTQFRLALVAKEAGLKSPRQIIDHFARQGVQIWSSRADQVTQTMSRFSRGELERALELIYATDKSLRDFPADQRVVMEDFILRLTAGLPAALRAASRA